jgi:general secretion pathway protein A
MAAMYHQYFGLNEAPFSIAVNPRYLFMSARHRDALAHLLYGVGTGGGFILLTGEVGTGKTTINRCLLEQLPHDTDIAIILNPALNAMELLATACDELGISYDRDNHTLKSLTDALHAFLLENHANGRKTVLMIDEAQHLDFDVLEQIRLLTNLETHSEKLLQIILIGQPELAQLLARPELRQLNQRITARYNLEPLNLSETGAYIHHRLQVAGMTPDREIFPPGVVKGVYRQTRGIPRLINVLCDRILLGAYGRNKSKADMSMLRLAAREVMGEELAATGTARTLTWAALAGLVLVAALGLWWWQARAPVSMLAQEAPPAAPDVAVSAPAAEAPAPQADATSMESTAAVVQAAPVPEVKEPTPAPEVEEPAPVPEVVRAQPADWLLSPLDAETILWHLYSPRAFPGELCGSVSLGDIACVERQVSTWDELAVLDRPLLLDMVTPERFGAGVVLLGLQGRKAWVLDADGALRQLELAGLAPLWSGKFRFLWHAPGSFERPLSMGDSSPVVAHIATLFARLDGQEKALTGTVFNEPLKRRVILFQRANGLEDDGVVGMRTLLSLNAALGIDPSASELRQQLSANVGTAL